MFDVMLLFDLANKFSLFLSMVWGDPSVNHQDVSHQQTTLSVLPYALVARREI